MREKRRNLEIQRHLEYGSWETLPISDVMREISDDEKQASIYSLEQALADDTDYTKEEVRDLLKHAIHEGQLERDGEWITLASENHYKLISTWDEAGE